MKHGNWIGFGVAAAFGGLLVSACGGDDSKSGPPRLDAGNQPDQTTPGGSDGSAADGPTTDGGFTLTKAPPAPDPSTLSAGQLLLTASGEILALDGYNFPAVNQGDPVFADGWEIRFDHFMATFDKVSMYTNPDKSPTDQSQVGNLVAEIDGPWAVDLHQNAAAYPYIDGKEAGERAVAFAAIVNQNKNGNAAFPTDGTRFAIGFDAVTAAANALNVNLGPDGLARYKYMIDNGCVALYVGQAVWRGDQTGGLCTPGAPATDGGADAGGPQGHGAESEFANLPKTVNFDFCFKSPTTYINCDNQDNDPATPFTGEPHQRGIAFKANTYVVGEVTFHTDHPFWESTKHDTPARFDQFAAAVTGGTGIATVHLEDVKGVDYTGFKDKQGYVLPWRTCDPNYQDPNGGSRIGQMHFDPVLVPHCTGNNPATGLCDYDDYSTYNQSTQGHWNGSDGLCFVKRNYPSPP
jgi:hypothetical protein